MSEETKAECQLESQKMTLTRVAPSASQSFCSAPFVGLRNTLPSDIEIVSPFIDQLMRFISRFRSGEQGNFGIELALREALVNAVVHGNQEDPQKRVYVNCRCNALGEVSIRVEDEGSGFESDHIPDPTSPDNRLQTHGRGIFLMRTLMDDVHYEQGGSVVHMRKRANADSDKTGKTQ